MRYAVLVLLLFASCSRAQNTPPAKQAIEDMPKIIFQTGHGVKKTPKPPPDSGNIVAPTLPTAVASDVVPYSLPTGGTTYNITSGQDLQAALNAAQYGDVITIEAGATFTGTYYVPEGKTGTGWLYIISSNMGGISAEGVRIDPTTHAAFMPTLKSLTYAVDPNQGPCLNIIRGVNRVRVCGIILESGLTTRDSGHNQYGLVRIAQGSSGSGTSDRIVFDRCWIHGTTTGNSKDGFQVEQVSNCAIINCYIDEIHTNQNESHGIQVNQTIGPMLIHNNTIEAATENIMVYDELGTLHPTDLTITHNTIRKPLTWCEAHASYAGIAWSEKNIIEVKNCHRCLIEGNEMYYAWTLGQQGEAFVITCREGINGSGIIEDITIRYNYVHDTGRFMNIGTPESGPIHRCSIKHNVWGNMAGILARTYPIEFPVAPSMATDISICHNTFISTEYPTQWLVFTGAESKINRVEFKDNLANHGNYGLNGNTYGIGLVSMEFYCDNYMVRNNALIDDSGTVYVYYAETATFGGWIFPLGISAVGFTNTALTSLAHFKLAPTSAYLTSATDGTPIGANVDAIIAAIP